MPLSFFNWPHGKTFAFTVFDDTDLATLQNVRELYDFLLKQGFRTTKSVWPLAGSPPRPKAGSTCSEPEYRDWLLELQQAGFEIGYHNATYDTSTRDRTILGLARFSEIFSRQPRAMANHANCRENIYWGSYRLTGIEEIFYNLVTGNRNKNKFYGHIEGNEYFWGDLCKEKIHYVRNFVFKDINTLKQCPMMPYQDPHRPWVNYWFASSEGANSASFNDCLSEVNQDRLEAEGGLCIMYTHFANGFWQSGELNPRFKFLMTRLSQKNGWFAPVSTILDYILDVRGPYEISLAERKRLERKWLWNKVFLGST